MIMKTFLPSLMVMTLLLFGALARQVEADEDVDPQLKERVSEYWQATVEADWATTFRLEMKSRDTQSPLDPMTYYKEKQSKNRFHAAVVDSIEVTEDRATAKLSASEIKIIGANAFQIPRFIESRWERLNGDWYQVEWVFYIPEAIRELQRNRQAAEKAAKEAACEKDPRDCQQPPVESAVPLTDEQAR